MLCKVSGAGGPSGEPSALVAPKTGRRRTPAGSSRVRGVGVGQRLCRAVQVARHKRLLALARTLLELRQVVLIRVVQDLRGTPGLADGVLQRRLKLGIPAEVLSTNLQRPEAPGLQLLHPQHRQARQQHLSLLRVLAHLLQLQTAVRRQLEEQTPVVAAGRLRRVRGRSLDVRLAHRRVQRAARQGAPHHDVAGRKRRVVGHNGGRQPCEAAAQTRVVPLLRRQGRQQHDGLDPLLDVGPRPLRRVERRRRGSGGAHRAVDDAEHSLVAHLVRSPPVVALAQRSVVETHEAVDVLPRHRVQRHHEKLQLRVVLVTRQLRHPRLHDARRLRKD
eukprot:Rhum_TRINITY_DN9086_c0_g1::Rhum_TRINITY_DN9086_c0_g1_i1::g.31046::m.31046